MCNTLREAILSGRDKPAKLHIELWSKKPPSHHHGLICSVLLQESSGCESYVFEYERLHPSGIRSSLLTE